MFDLRMQARCYGDWNVGDQFPLPYYVVGVVVVAVADVVVVTTLPMH